MNSTHQPWSPLPEELHGVLRHIPFLSDTDVATVLCTYLGGTTNQSFVFRTAQRKFVVRIPLSGTPAVLNRQAERHNTQRMSDCGINIPTLFFDPLTGIKVSPWLDGASLEPTDLRNHAVLEEVCALLCRVHGSEIEFQSSFRPLHVFEDIAATLDSLPREMASYREDFFFCRDQFLASAIRTSPCHADLYCGNMFRAGGRLYLIDWEHSGPNDPVYDLADLSVQADFTTADDDTLLKLYAAHSNRAISREHFFHAQQLSRLVWGLWALARAIGNSGDAAHLRAGRRKLMLAREALRSGC